MSEGINLGSREKILAAMAVAGYSYDELESTEDNLRFIGPGGAIITMAGWKEAEDWLNGVLFDYPQISDQVEMILHPEYFPENKDEGRNKRNEGQLKSEEKSGNENLFRTDNQRISVLEELKNRQSERKPGISGLRFYEPEERSLV